jgi:hypothetical protein
MAINFPDSPSVDDVFVSGDKTWVWNGTTWSSNPSSVPLNTLGDVTITSPATGEVVQYNGSQWVNEPLSTVLTNYDTSTEVDGKIAALVDSAPATLDTLNELAAALGDDANFATTVTDAIAAKAPLRSPYSAIGANYTLVASDTNTIKSVTGSYTITIPANVLTDGDRVDIINFGTGTVTFAAGSGMTLRSKDDAVTIDARYAAASIVFSNSTNAFLIGDLA